MKKIKILKKNSKIKFMIAAVIIFSITYLLFGLLIYFSPMVNWKEGGQKASFNAIYDAYNKERYSNGGFDIGIYEYFNDALKFMLFNFETKNFAIVPDQFTIFYLPIFIGGSSLVLIFFRMIIHTVGYNNQTKKGVARIVKPIRSFQITMIISWICIALLLLSSLLSFLAASPYLMGFCWEFGASGIVSITSNVQIADDIQNILLGANGEGFQPVYWLSLAIFFNNFSQGYNSNEALYIWIWIMTPTLPLILFGLFGFLGVILGEASWWNINLVVLRDIDASTGMNIAKEYDYVKPVKIKANVKKQKPDKGNGSIVDIGGVKYDTKVFVNFYTSLAKMLDKSKNSGLDLYQEAKMKISRLTGSPSEVDWQDELNQIENKMDILTGIEQKFIDLLVNIIEKSKFNVFGRYRDDLIELIDEYRYNVKEWNVYECEAIIEQIFAIALKREELLAKVGLCVRKRLSNSFKHIDDKLDIVNKLEYAKNGEDYDEYRNVCLEVIEKMSPIKSKFNSYAKKIIYN
ncbi:hypothetical protein [Spiroplasma tabanidicola]|uniref:Uncharacterized protein n=1 Tax=Spiroplasma tabanidicola TaxID=324079 RepID=A0A6I6CDA1_9MOLU|nr:hypothetical protein [Spiroplasma tabanidicola]QGS51954.1 hypothetical protein STABA_v1c05910 [Spiroplasma tabanidicola]